MRTGFFTPLIALLALAGFGRGPCRAEEPAAPAEPKPAAPAAAEPLAPPRPPAPAATEPSAHDPVPCCEKTPSQRLWGGSEYLFWWVRKGPLPIPLVTANPDQTTIAALNEPGTAVLFGGDGLDYHRFSGVRTTIGGWLDCNQRFGLEGSGFLLERRSADFRADTPGVGGPVLGVPFNATAPFLLNPAGETTFNNGGAPATISVFAPIRLWGAEVNALVTLARGQRYSLGLLAGARYLDLEEGLNLTAFFPDQTTGGDVTVRDAFGTRNQFYGGQLGTRFEWKGCRTTLQGTAKVAIGPCHEVLNVGGGTVVTNGAFANPTGTFPGGVFAEPSNSGRSAHDEFTVVPEVQVRAGYNLTRNIQGFVGYNFLYATDLVRPGNQIDRNINPTQNGLFGGTGGVLTGPAQPVPMFNRSDFWVHGVNFGLELRF